MGLTMETKNCSFCGEEILSAAKKCKHCGEWLEKDDENEKDNIVPPKKSHTIWIIIWWVAVLLFATLPFHYGDS